MLEEAGKRQDLLKGTIIGEALKRTGRHDLFRVGAEIQKSIASWELLRREKSLRTRAAAEGLLKELGYTIESFKRDMQEALKVSRKIGFWDEPLRTELMALLRKEKVGVLGKEK